MRGLSKATTFLQLQRAFSVGAAAGCDLLTLIVSNFSFAKKKTKIKRSQPSAAPTLLSFIY
jgi:hypothetical protein